VLYASRLQSCRVTPHPPWPCCFQLTFAGLHLAAGPRFLAKTGSSSRALPLLYRVLTDSDPPEPLRVRAPSLGFTSQSRRQHRESTCGELPTALPMFRPQRFSRSRRFAPLAALRACFIPLPRPGFTLQGLSPQPSHRDSSPRRPLVSLTTLASSRVTPTVQLLPSRLQGVDPGCDPLRRQSV